VAVVTAAVISAAAVTAVVISVAVVTAAVISVADGTEGAVTGEDMATVMATRTTEDTAIPIIPTILTGIGQLSVILTAGATEFGFDDRFTSVVRFRSARFFR
jgi:hypothetical protein